MKKKNTVLVVGASGVNGYAVTRHFKDHKDFNVLTLSRNSLYYEHDKKQHLQIDLLKNKAYAKYKKQLSQVTHIFYAALKPDDDPGTEADENEKMMNNCVTLVRKYSDQLQHITFLQGGKVYGAHLGTYKTPAVEDQTRHFPPNLYFQQEDYCKKISKESSISYTAIRPDIVIGYSLYSAMNLGNLIGVYATICKETGMDFMFPGSKKGYHILANVTDSDLVGHAVAWSFNNKKTKNEAFNITNGDVFRWQSIWEDIADFYGMKVGYPQPLQLEKYFDANEERWKHLVKKYQLQNLKIADIAKGDFGDFIFNVEDDAIFDVNKARRNGFDRMHRKTSESIISHLKDLQKRKIIPAYK